MLWAAAPFTASLAAHRKRELVFILYPCKQPEKPFAACRPPVVYSCLQSTTTSPSPSLEGWLLGKSTLMRQLVKGRNRLAQEPEELCDCRAQEQEK